jgi:hypothetical protein
MNKGSLISILLVLIIIAAIAYKVLLPQKVNYTNAKNTNNAHSKPNLKNHDTKSKFKDDVKDINRHPNKINYTKHAKCRMSCRQFSEEEVIQVLENGKVNWDKSNDRQSNCPTYALEGVTNDGQLARMVFAFCNKTEATVITVIDLKTDFKCNCY